MAGGNKKSFSSRAGIPPQYDPEELKGNREHSTSHPSHQATDTTVNPSDPHNEGVEGSEDEEAQDVPLQSSFDSENGPDVDSELAYHDDSPEGPRSPSQPRHSRDAQLQQSNGPDHSHVYSTKSREVDRERSNSPRKRAQSSHVDQVLDPRIDGGTDGPDDVASYNTQDHAASLSSARHQSSSSSGRAPSSRNQAPEYHRSNSDDHRHHRTAGAARQGTRNHTHRGPPRQATEPVSSTHSNSQQDYQVSQSESSDPTIRRIYGIASSAANAIYRDGGSSFQTHFWRLVNTLTKEIKQSEDKVNALSKEMLDGRDRYQPVPDGKFQDSMNQLRSLVKVLAQDISKAQIVQAKDLRQILQENLLTENLTESIDDDYWRKNKKYLIQSALWKILKTHFFQNPFQLYGEEGQKLGRTWKELFYHGKQQNTTDVNFFRPTEFSERWKSLTVTRLSEKHEIGDKELDGARQAVLDTLADPITAGTLIAGYNPEIGWGKNLREVLRNAAELAITMASQRNRLEFYVPDIVVLQTDGNVHALGKVLEVEDDEDCSDRVDHLGFVVVPGLRRRGDGLGSNLQYYLDLEAARIKCID